MEKSICPNNITIRESLNYINSEPAGIAFIVNKEKKLQGVVTDGDIRRILLEGANLDDKICNFISDNFVYAKLGEDIQELLKKTNKKVKIIPILNSDFKPVDYFRYQHKTHYTPVAEPKLYGNEIKYVNDALLSTWISSRGEYITRFEQEFSSFCNTQFGLSTSNGTVSIHLALKALGIGKGDEVILPDLTFAATINAVLLSGAKPVIVDVDIDSWTISPKAIKEAINNKTKAIIPVHIYGQPCEMSSIMKIAKKNNLYVIEDCAEAHGAEYNGKKVGSFGDISTFSFFGNKIITTGEGGMCLTNSKRLYNRMMILRDHGMSKSKRYWHTHVGFNYRMTNIQAAIGCAQLENINNILLKNQSIENCFKKICEKHGLKMQISFPESKKVVWLVCVIVKEARDELINELKNNNIESRPFFYPLSSMPIYKKYSFSKNINCNLISKKGINLPTVENIDYEKIELILKKFNNVNI